MGEFRLTRPPATGTQTFTYVATGTEGKIVPAPQLAGHIINLVTYNTLVLIPETPPPDQQGYYYSAPNLILGIPLNLGDVLQVLYT